MIAMTARQLAHAMKGEVVRGDPARPFAAVTTDSRKPTTGALFVALVGPRFDGHDFVRGAIEGGAAGAVVNRAALDRLRETVSEQAILIAVEDTQRALEDLGRAVRLRHPGRVIAMTGSVGKTTVKDMAAAALRPFGKVAATLGNLNNHIGVPLTLAATTGDEAHVVLEMGMSHPGEIALLANIARPHVAVVTAAAAAHLENFDSVDGIADAKCELFEHLAPDAIAVANADDPRILARARRLAPGRLLTWGRAEDADVRVLSSALTETPAGLGLAVELSAAGRPLSATLPTIGSHNATNAAAAIAIAIALGLDPAAALASLAEHFRASPHRLDVTRPRAGLTIVDDAYNANPASMLAALDTLPAVAAAAGAERLVLVLGTMHELGPDAPAMHAEVGAAAAALQPALIVATGAHAADLARGAAGARVVTASDALSPDALAALHRETAPGAGPTVVLLKGSRAERLERLVTVLAQHPTGGA
jgi:UDP-N-acetylmuramoyl-tripeptide--D-alanyl-D-alanine ligase